MSGATTKRSVWDRQTTVVWWVEFGEVSHECHYKHMNGGPRAYTQKCLMVQVGILHVASPCWEG